jgi:D-lactate dehydrogenase
MDVKDNVNFFSGVKMKKAEVKPLKVAIFSSHAFERKFLEDANSEVEHELLFLETRLTPETAGLALGCAVVSAFANDDLSSVVLQKLADLGVVMIALRSAGYNHVDLQAAQRLRLQVVRVPEYSPYSVAEHAVALLQTLNRKIHKAYSRVRENNFSLDGLVGFDLHGKTIGVIGTGKIGRAFVSIMKGYGTKILTYDLFPDPDFEKESGCRYVSLPELVKQSDVISLHVPLKKENVHMISLELLSQMKKGAYIVNTSRGKLIDTRALIQKLKSGDLGGACLDVYEEEAGIFFEDRSDEVMTDDVLERLLTFPNVLLTAHQAFLTSEALAKIASTTIESISDFSLGQPLRNVVLS